MIQQQTFRTIPELLQIEAAYAATHPPKVKREDKPRKNLSKAAKETLLSRSRYYDYNGAVTWNCWFGYGNNAATRELEAAGLVESVQFGWSRERVITRAGWELAETLHAEQLRLQRGVSMSEFKLKPLIPLDKPGWIAAEVKPGRWMHTNGCLLALGKATSTQIEGSRLTVEHFIERSGDYLPSNERVLRLAECSPIGVQAAGREGQDFVVWFDCGECLNSPYYSHVLRLFPKATWRHAGKHSPFYALVGGEVVAVVMPWRETKIPEGLAHLVRSTAAKQEVQ